MLPRHRITEPSWCWLLSTIWIINISNCTGNSYFITGCCKCFSRDSSSLCKRHEFLHVPMGCTMPEVPDFSSFCFPHLGLYCHIFSCDVLDPISIGLEICVADFFFLVPCRWHTCKLQHSFVSVVNEKVAVTCLIFLGQFSESSCFIFFCVYLCYIHTCIISWSTLLISSLPNLQDLSMEFT